MGVLRHSCFFADLQFILHENVLAGFLIPNDFVLVGFRKVPLEAALISRIVIYDACLYFKSIPVIFNQAVAAHFSQFL